MSASLKISDPLAHQLAELMAAGIAVPEGLEAAAAEAESRRLRAALRRLADAMRRGAVEGADGEASLQRLTAMLIAGSRSGAELATALATLDEVDTRSSRLRRKLHVAWIYPAVMLALSTVCGLAVVGITGAAYTDLYEEFSLLGRDEVLTYLRFQQFLWGAILAVVGTALVAAIASRFYRAAWSDRLYWHVPLVGAADRWLDLSVVCAVVSQLLRREVPYPEALRTARPSVRSAALRRWLEQMATDVEAGHSIDSATMRLGRHAEVLPALVEPRGVAAVDPAGSWDLARQYFYRRAIDRIRLVRAVVPIFGYLAVIIVVLSILQAALAPLFGLTQLISSLG